MTYSIDFRRKVLSAREKEGLTIAQVAKRFCVGVSSVTRWIKAPNLKLNRNKPATKTDMETLGGGMFTHIQMLTNMNARPVLA